MTLPVTCEVARLSITDRSYEKAQSTLKWGLGLNINDDTMRKVTNCVGTIVFNKDLEIANGLIDKLNKGLIEFYEPKIDGILYLEADGAMLPTRDNDQKGVIYKENKLGIAFTSSDIRTWKDKHGKIKHELTKKEFTAFIGGSLEFSHLLFYLAIRNGYGRYKSTVLLSDGASWIRKIKDDYFPDAQQILDLYHLKEHIAEIGRLMFDKDTIKLKTWTDEISDLFLKSEPEKAIDMMIKSTKNRFKDMMDKFKNYIINNRNNIDYATYIKQGIFIGSGAIESGNKVIVQRRMRTNGSMRWRPDTGQAVVTLITKLESGLWLRDVIKTVYEHYGEAFDRRPSILH
jgi:hypothetical protein